MRKLVFIIALFLIATVAAGVIAAPAAKDMPIKVILNGSAKALKPQAIMRGQTAYVPLEATAKELKAAVKYDKAKKTYIVTSAGKSATIRESEGIKVNGVFMVSSGVAAKAFGCSAVWETKTMTLRLNSRVSSPRPPVSTPKPVGGG
jgi:uncharacterized SAM-binding protein YcdF (DUF218 family)